MLRSFRLLLIDDSVDDAENVIRTMHRAGLMPEVRQIWRWEDLQSALEQESWDFILCDHRLPTFDSSDVLKLVHQMNLTDVPFILISGEIDVQTAVAKMREGACDFILKDDLSRLVPAIQREREQAQVRLEKRRAEQELRESNQKLRLTLSSLASVQQQLIASERFRALGQMASGIAHDFNNSLAKILGITELLECRPHADLILLRQMKTVVGDAAEIVRRLLDFYREAPVKKLRAVNPEEILNEVKDFTRPRWQNGFTGGSTVEVIVQAQAIRQGLADASQLREILTNLVFNACDALSNGGVIELISQDTDEHVELVVKDNGSGMSEEVLKRCLEPLFTTKGERGTGMGLAIASSLVESFGGGMRVESREGEGTSVILSLRRAGGGGMAVDGRRETTLEPSEIPVSQTSHSLKILVVDDEPVITDLLAQLLTLSGHQVKAFYDPQEALHTLKAQRFDVVISDRSMPGLKGDSLALEVRRLDPQCRFFMMTGFGDIMALTAELPPGVDLILTKPVTRKSLEDALQAIVPKPQASVASSASMAI